MCKYCDEYNQYRAEQEQGLSPEFTSLSYCYTDRVHGRVRQKELREFTIAAERHGGFDRVYVDNVVEHREDIRALRAYATIHILSDNSDTRGCQIVEGHIQCSSLAELAAATQMLLTGYAVVIDKETLEILESVAY